MNQVPVKNEWFKMWIQFKDRKKLLLLLFVVFFLLSYIISLLDSILSWCLFSLLVVCYHSAAVSVKCVCVCVRWQNPVSNSTFTLKFDLKLVKHTNTHLHWLLVGHWLPVKLAYFFHRYPQRKILVLSGIWNCD